LNGIKYIKNGRLAAQERDSLKLVVNIFEQRIANYQKLIINFERTVKEHVTKDSARLAQIAYYKQEIQIHKDLIAEHRKALQELKRRSRLKIIFLSVLTVAALFI